MQAKNCSKNGPLQELEHIQHSYVREIVEYYRYIFCSCSLPLTDSVRTACLSTAGDHHGLRVGPMGKRGKRQHGEGDAEKRAARNAWRVGIHQLANWGEAAAAAAVAAAPAAAAEVVRH